MKNTYFNVKIEFNRNEVDTLIERTTSDNGKGYVCSIERNIITTAYYNTQYRKIINSSLVNILDGSIVAMFLGFALKKKPETYIGADLFINYIQSKKYKSYFLGNTSEVLSGLKSNLTKYDDNIKNMIFQTLPFQDVDQFDYEEIAKQININNPDIIWISLGAPKQEMFMSRLLPHLNRGVMFGFGAIFNFYSGINKYKRAPKILLKLKMEWLYRVYQEPKKNIKRNLDFLKIIPILIKEQKKMC